MSHLDRDPDPKGPRAGAGPQGAKSGRERRQTPRVSAAWPVTLLLSDGPHKARLRDVSRAGVCMYLDRPVALMTLLALSLDLPDKSHGGTREVKGSGAVVRCERIAAGVEHYEIAVFLHDMTESDRLALDEHVRGLLTSHAV